jgi:hypothetical protein
MFDSSVTARVFVKRYYLELRHPCLVEDEVVHIVLPKSDFEAASLLAADLNGSILYAEW